LSACITVKTEKETNAGESETAGKAAERIAREAAMEMEE
jgi:hypothetical protein